MSISFLIDRLIVAGVLPQHSQRVPVPYVSGTNEALYLDVSVGEHLDLPSLAGDRYIDQERVANATEPVGDVSTLEFV